MTLPALVNLEGMSDEECYAFGMKIYGETFLWHANGRGTLKTHDDLDVHFYADRYAHAFRTSPDRARWAYDKSKVAVTRIARIGWIKEVMLKNGGNVVCKEQRPPPQWKRAYYCYDNAYVVWLEPTKPINGKPPSWKFSSAYPLPVAEFKRVAHGFKTVA